MGLFSKPAPKGAPEKKRLPNGGRLSKPTSYCKVCRRGTCGCAAIARADRAAAQKKNRPIPCGRSFPSGGTCYRTVAPGETCPRH